MSKAKLTANEWQIVRDAPFWVQAAMAIADGRQALIIKRKESKALDKALSSYKTSNSLVRDVMANEEKAAKEIKKASASDVEKALGRISQIVENKCGAADLDAFNAFLLDIGNQVAAAGGEGLLGMGKNVSDKETAALQAITRSLRATDADKRARQQAEAQAARRQRAETAAATKAKKEAAEKAKQAGEAAKKAAGEKQKRAVKARAEKRRRASEEKEISAQKKLSERKAAMEETAQKQAEALAARREAAAAATAKAAEAAEAAKFIAEYTVVSGDNLSFISKKHYGSANHWKLIYEANKDIIGDNPSLIRVGQVYKIPRLP